MYRRVFCLLIWLMVFLASNAAFAGEYRIVTFGDSTTATRGSLKIYSEILEEKLKINGQKVRVINSGIPGDHTARARKRFRKDVLDHKPDLVVIQFGINDAAVDVYKTPPAKKSRISKEEYRKNLHHFVTELKSQGIQVILMTPNPCRWTEALKKRYGHPPYDPEDPDGFNVLLRDYAVVVREIASAEEIPLIDIYKEFQEYGKQKDQSVDDLLLDGMHPNTKGQDKVAKLLIKEIQNSVK